MYNKSSSVNLKDNSNHPLPLLAKEGSSMRRGGISLFYYSTFNFSPFTFLVGFDDAGNEGMADDIFLFEANDAHALHSF